MFDKDNVKEKAKRFVTVLFATIVSCNMKQSSGENTEKDYYGHLSKRVWQTLHLLSIVHCHDDADDHLPDNQKGRETASAASEGDGCRGRGGEGGKG